MGKSASNGPSSDPSNPSPGAASQSVTMPSTDTSHAAAMYSNFCRCTGTAEEIILDFGLNSQPMGTPAEPIPITQRVVVNYYTAKRLLGALHMTIKHHEDKFGVLETDVQKRSRQQAKP